MIRALVRALLLTPLLLVGWVLATESGLELAVRAAGMLTGERLQMTGASGRLIGTVGFDEVVYEHPAATVRLHDVRLDLRLSRLLVASVQAESVSASSLRVTTHVREAVGRSEPLTVRPPLRVAVEQGGLGRFDLSLKDGRHQWSASDVRFAAHWRDQWIVIDKISAVTKEAGPVFLRGRLAMADDLLLLKEIKIEGPGEAHVEAHVDGYLALSDAVANALDADWKPLRWPALDGFESTSGRVHLEGPWSNYGWNLDAELALPGASSTLAATGRGNLDQLTIHRMQLAALGGKVHGSGQVDWSGVLHTAAKLEFEQLDPGLQFPGWNGSISGSASFSGSWRDRVPMLEFAGGLRDSQLRGYPLALTLRGSTQDRAVLLHELVLQSGDSTLRAHGALLPELDLSGDLASTDLRSLWAGLSGSAKLHAELKGDPGSPRVDVGGTGTGLAFQPQDGAAYRAARATLNANVSLQGRSHIELQLDDVDFGLFFKRLSLNGEGTADRHALRLEAAGEAGEASLQLEGRYAPGQWQGHLQQTRLAPVGETPWLQAQATGLNLEKDRWRLESLCLRNQGSQVCGEAQEAAGGRQLAVAVQQFDLGHLKHWLPDEWNLSGSISGHSDLRWRGSQLTAIDANLQSTAGTLEGAGVSLAFGAGSLVVEPQQERLHARLQLHPAGGNVELDAWLAAGGPLVDRPLVGDARVRLPDLAWLPVLSTEIASAQGALESQLSLSGTLRKPELEGRVAVSGARVQLATPGIELTDISAVFESGKKQPLTVSVRAQSGGGSLQLDGGIASLRPRIKGKFTLTGEGAQWINTPEIRAWVTPKLELVLDGPDSKLTGDIHVPRAGITPRQLSSGGVGPSADQVLVDPTTKPGGRALHLESDVRIVLGEEVRFNGFGLKTRLEGAIDASDRPGRPTRGHGELRLIGGRYKAYGQDLTIETGRLLFSGGPVTEPGIELSAYRQPDERVRVGLRARGSLAAPTFSLYSDPAMSQEEQLSWLVLGRPLRETLQSGQRPELDSAAASLGFAGGEYLANRLLAPRVGVDELSVGRPPGETVLPDATGPRNQALMIGKYLSPRLFVSYGFGLLQPGRFFRLQYDLGRGFKLTGESGEVQGGDLIYTIER